MPELDLQQMSREEKLKTMHALWEDLAADESAVDSPVWHETALQEAEVRMLAGTERTLDWEDAKEELRKRAR